MVSEIDILIGGRHVWRPYKYSKYALAYRRGDLWLSEI